MMYILSSNREGRTHTLMGFYRYTTWGVSGVSNALNLLTRSIAPHFTKIETQGVIQCFISDKRS